MVLLLGGHELLSQRVQIFTRKLQSNYHKSYQIKTHITYYHTETNKQSVAHVLSVRVLVPLLAVFLRSDVFDGNLTRSSIRHMNTRSRSYYVSFSNRHSLQIRCHCDMALCSPVFFTFSLLSVTRFLVCDTKPIYFILA